MAALASLLENHKEPLSAEFKTAISVLDSKIDRVQTTVSDYRQRITSLESNADSVSECLDTLEAMCTKLAASNVKLKVEAADLEARSRHNNILIIGLPESIEGPWLTSFFSDLPHQLLGEQILPSPPDCITPIGC